MKSIALSLALVCGVSLNTAAQSNKEAKQWLQDASKKIKSAKTMTADFTIEIKNERVSPPIQEKNAGQLVLSGQDYAIKTKGAQRIKKGKWVYEIVDEFKEVYVSEPGANGDDEILTPNNLIDKYMKGYSYKMGGTEKIKQRTVNYIILKPNASEEVDYITVGIFADTKELYSLVQKGTNGTETKIVISNTKMNQPLPAGALNVDEKALKAKGYSIIR